MIKYLIFDFDGTLVDSMNIGIDAVNVIAEKHDFNKVKQEDIGYLRGLSIIERCKYLNVHLYNIPFWAAEFYNLYKHAMEQLKLFEGIRELLKELHDSGYNIAILSSNSEHNIRSFFKRNKLEYIKQILCSNKILGKDKMINRFLKRNKLKKSEVIYVGDEERDIIACKKCGIKIIWVSWGFDTIDLVKEQKPDYIAHSPKEILSIVETQ